MRPNLKTQLVCSIFSLYLLSASSLAWSATNIGRANLGADPTLSDTDYITDSATLTITSATLAVVKKAFLDDNTGTEIVSGSSVVKGSIVKFIIYIDNSTSTQSSDVRLEDQLNDTDFTYQAGSLTWNNNTTNSAASLATIFNDTNASGSGISLSDAINADVASANVAVSPDLITMGAHTGQTNGVVNIPAGKVVSFMFRARIN